MREEELYNLVRKVQKRQTEFQTIELKAAAGGFPKKIYDTLSSFSNQDDGGTIIFGVSEENSYDVVGVYNVENAQKKAMEACEQMEPSVRAVFTNTEIDGKIVLSAEIPPVEYWRRPVFYKGAGRIKGSYVRVGDADEPMSEYEVYSYEAFRRRIRDELRTVPECRPELLDQSRLKQYLEAVKQERKNLSSLPDSEIMELMGITQKGEFTLAAVLVFGAAFAEAGGEPGVGAVVFAADDADLVFRAVVDILPIEHIKEVVLFIFTLTIRVAEHKAEACLIDTVAVLLQANLGIIVKRLFRIVVKT